MAQVNLNKATPIRVVYNWLSNGNGGHMNVDTIDHANYVVENLRSMYGANVTGFIRDRGKLVLSF